MYNSTVLIHMLTNLARRSPSATALFPGVSFSVPKMPLWQASLARHLPPHFPQIPDMYVPTCVPSSMGHGASSELEIRILTVRAAFYIASEAIFRGGLSTSIAGAGGSRMLLPRCEALLLWQLRPFDENDRSAEASAAELLPRGNRAIFGISGLLPVQASGYSV